MKLKGKTIHEYLAESVQPERVLVQARASKKLVNQVRAKLKELKRFKNPNITWNALFDSMLRRFLDESK